MRSSWHFAVAAITAIGVGASAFVKLFDPDVWWHIRVGEWIWRHRALPVRDPFSWTSDLRYGWHPVLAELVLFAADAAGGPTGVVLLSALGAALAGAVVFLLARDESIDSHLGPVVACASTALWLGAAGFRLGPKPEVFSLMAIGVVLVAVMRSGRGPFPRWIWALPGLFAVWANVHRGGTMGAGFLVAAALVALSDRPSRATGWRLSLVAVLSTAALLCNPSGWKIFGSSFSVISTSSYARYIAEWAPISPVFLYTMGRWFSVVLLLWFVDVARRRRFDGETVIVALATVAAFKSVRLVPIAAVTMVPATSRQLRAALAWLVARSAAHVRSSVLLGATVAAAWISMAARYVTALPPSAWGVGVLDWRLPVAGVQFLRKAPPPCVRMWNNLNFGGYLLYSLAPRTKVFIDGRNDMVYSPGFFEQTQIATTDADVLRAQVRSYGVDCAVVQTSGLIETRYQGLLANRDFEPVYMDDLVTVMVRRSPQTEAYLSRYGYSMLRPQDAIPRAARFADDPDRARFAQEALRNAAESPASIRAWFVLGLISKTVGDSDGYARAKERVRALAEERGIQVPPM